MLRPVHRHDERGAVFPATLVMMGVIFLIISLVIDVGGDRIVRRDMQSIADVLALDVVRNLDGRAASGYTGYDSTGPSSTLFSTAKQESLDRQAAIADPDTVTVRLAVTDKDSGAFVRWAAPSDVPNAVQVWTTGSSAFRFLPSVPRRTNLQRSALAVLGPPVACISAGATFIELVPQGPLDTFLGKLIGVDRLTILDPSGLASLDLEIPILDLATALGVGSVDQIATANVTAHDFVIAMADVLSHQGSSASLLNGIAAHLSDSTNLNIGSILSLNTGNQSAADIAVNAFSLLQAVIMAANKDTFVNLNLTGSFPGLASVTSSAKVVQPPQIACGPVGTTAHSAQLQVKVSADVTALNGLVASASFDPIFVTAADGSGTITSITCVGTSRSLSVQATTAAGKVGAHVLTDLLLHLTHVTVDAGGANGASIGTTSSQTLNFTFPTSDLPPGQTAGTAFGSLGLSTITPISISVSGLPVSNLLDGIVKPLLGIIDPLVSAVLRPTLTSLGVNVGTVRIQPTSRPSCNNPFLRG